MDNTVLYRLVKFKHFFDPRNLSAVCATVHYGSQNFSGLHKKENVPNRSSVHVDLLLCSVEVYFKYVIHNYLL